MRISLIILRCGMMQAVYYICRLYEMTQWTWGYSYERVDMSR